MIRLHPKNQSGKTSLLREQSRLLPGAETMYMRKVYRLHSFRHLTPSAYILRFDRNGMAFRAGHHLTAGVPGNNQVREYSIYSSEQDDFLEILVKEVENGLVSKQLKKLIPGELLDIDGPFGFFTIDESQMNRKFLFVATGTGIAPFHSIAGSYPNLSYTVLHGVRTADEAYEKYSFPRDQYVLCTSRDEQGDFNGRVTDYLRQRIIDLNTMVYLCGNCDMIYDVYDLLTSRGLPAANIKTEVYF